MRCRNSFHDFSLMGNCQSRLFQQRNICIIESQSSEELSFGSPNLVALREKILSQIIRLNERWFSIGRFSANAPLLSHDDYTGTACPNNSAFSNTNFDRFTNSGTGTG
jgi:hypothetical protein